MIELRDLRYAYSDGREALAGVGCSIEAGEKVALVGPNGAGKSTLLLHLNGVLPDRPGARAAGAVTIDGLPAAGPNLPAIRAKVGLLFQDPDDQLFCPSVIEDVAFGPLQQGLSAAEARLRAVRAMESVGLSASLADRPPHHLSLGEKKRACLAGILACEPRVLALDEPTSNLDPRGRRRLLGVLAGLPQTIVVATHDLELALELCGRVILLDEGLIRADGPVASILSNEPLLLAHGLESPASLGRQDR